MRETTYSTAVISPEMLKPVLSGDLSSAKVTAIETQIGAYFDLNPATFGGILFHSDGRGPEKPYFFPDEKDLLPVTQAVARIGVQFHYWDMLHQALDTGRVALTDADSLEILAIKLESPGNLHKVLGRNQLLFGVALNLGLVKGRVDLTHGPDGTERIAKKRGMPDPEHSAYIRLSNYGGDADFWGAWENSIFPMRVQINRPNTSRERQSARVQIKELGLDSALVQTTWESWANLDAVKGNQFHSAVERLLLKSLFHSQVNEVLSSAVAKGKTIKHGADVATTLIKGGVVANEVLDHAMPIISRELQQMVFQEGRKEAIEAASELSENLNLMYQTARKFCRRVYPY